MIPQTPPLELPHKAYMLPQAVPMWPPAWWTWLALAIVILIVIGIVLLLIKRRHKRTYRREALASLKHADDNLLDKELITLCHELIRRCLVSENRMSLAALSIESLIEKLDEKLPTKQQFHLLSDDFINGPYRGNVELTAKQRENILSITRYWIRKHHV